MHPFDKSTLGKVKDYPYTMNLLVIENISEKDIKKIGWVQPEDVDGCSSNRRLNPYELELSHLVRVGQSTREEALSKVEDQTAKQLAEVMAELGITEKTLESPLVRQ